MSLLEPAFGLVFLFLFPVIIRLGSSALAPSGWQARVDVPLALLSSALAAVGAACCSGRYFTNSPFTASDFSEYCEIVDATIAGRPAISAQRSFLVAHLIAPLARQFGLIDGFALSAIASLFVIGLALYIWGHAIAGRAAALCSVVFLVACMPVAALARTISFYPPWVAVTALASGLTAMAMRTRSTAWLLAATSVVVSAPLFDQRNLVWTVVCLPILAVVAVLPRPGHRGFPLRVLALPVLLWMSWGLGPVAYVQSGNGSIEGQTRMLVNDLRRQVSLDPASVTCDPAKAFFWGHTDLRNLPATATCMRALNAAMPTDEQLAGNRADRWSAVATPWGSVVATCVAVICLGLGGSGVGRLAALVGPAVPFLVTAVSAYADPSLRHISASLVPVPLLLGVAWAVVVHADRGTPVGAVLARFARGASSAPARPVLVLTALVCGAVAVVLGVPFTAVAPGASTRAPQRADTEWAAVAAGVGRDRVEEVLCGARLDADAARGAPSIGDISAFCWGSESVAGEAYPGAPAPPAAGTRPSLR